MTTEQSILPAIQGLFYIVAGTDFNYVVQSLKDPQDLIQKSRETAAASSRTFLLLSVMFHAAGAAPHDNAKHGKPAKIGDNSHIEIRRKKRNGKDHEEGDDGQEDHHDHLRSLLSWLHMSS